MAKVNISDVNFAKRLRRDKRRIEEAMERSMQLTGAHIETQAKRAAPVSSGRLRAAITFRTKKKCGGKVGVEIGIMSGAPGQGAGRRGPAPLVYAQVQDTGKTIKKGKHRLAIPLQTSLAKRSGIVTRAGVSGVRARDVISSPAQFGLLDTRPSKKRTAIIGIFDTGKRGPLGGIIRGEEPIFALRDQVKVPGSGYLSGTARREYQRGVIRTFMDQAVREALARAGTET